MNKQTLDEYGTRWLVMARDPASKHINKLHSKGFQYIVLPRKTYRTGELVDIECDDYLMNVRMKDCVQCLK